MPADDRERAVDAAWEPVTEPGRGEVAEAAGSMRTDSGQRRAGRLGGQYDSRLAEQDFRFHGDGGKSALRVPQDSTQ